MVSMILVHLILLAQMWCYDSLDDVEFVYTGTGSYDKEFNVFFQTSSSIENAETQDYSVSCRWTEAYFEADSTKYNPSLATASLCLALSAFNSITNATEDEPYAEKDKNLKNFFQNIGIDLSNTVTTEYYTKEPLNDSIGAKIGCKDMDNLDYTLVVIGIRGGGYQNEWVSNAHVGSEGHHNGFNKAANEIMDMLKDYVYSQWFDKKLKIWFAGFSRGGGVANLLAGMLDSNAELRSQLNVDRKDIYCYTFEAPSGASISEEEKNKEIYNNIFNIINPNDLVPVLAPIQWQFRRYGTDIFLPAKDTSVKYNQHRAAMWEVFKGLESTKGEVDEIEGFRMRKVELAQLLEVSNPCPVNRDVTSSFAFFVDKLAAALMSSVYDSRATFVNKYQSAAKSVLHMLMGSPNAKTEELVKVIDSVDPLSIIQAMLESNDVFTGILESIKTGYNNLMDGDNFISAGLELLLPLCRELFGPSKDLLATAVFSLGSFAQAHFPELCYSWVRIMDPQFVGNVQASDYLSDDLYRLVEVIGKADIYVYNKPAAEVPDDTEPVMTFVNDMSQVIDASQCTCTGGIDEDDNKYLLVPNDALATIRIVPRTTDEQLQVNLRVYSKPHGCILNWNWFDLPVSQGLPLTMIIPTSSAAEKRGYKDKIDVTQYDLRQGGSSLRCEKRIGEDAKKAVCSVAVTLPADAHGLVTGYGQKAYGQSIVLRARKLGTEDFLGFTESADGDLLTSQQEYRLVVKKDTTVNGNFKQAQNVTAAPRECNEKGWSASAIVIVIVLSILFVAAAVAAVLFYIKWARLRSQSKPDDNGVYMREM